jgi:UDP-hydrolysing UDP-N-acetyl-D-glucosamine 2-epimerase
MRSNLGIVVTARPSYAKIKPLVNTLLSIGVEPDLYVCASALLPRYGQVSTQIEQDFPQLKRIHVPSVYEGDTRLTSVLSTATLSQGIGREFAVREPQMVVVMADRHETLGVSIAASYQNVPIAHLQGGEVSGNIDDKVRNANTMLADYHFPATLKAAERVFDMTGLPVYPWGCPSIDVARQAANLPPVTDQELGGEGPSIDLSKPFLTVLYHPETERPELAGNDTFTLISRLKDYQIPLVVFWPGQDAGMEEASKAIRVIKAHAPLRTVRTLPPERFLRLMYQTTALVGNSSAGIRECSFIGTPVFNIGHRQRGRERANNVRDDLPPNWSDIIKYHPSTLYGDGYAAPKIAAKLKNLLCQ